MSFAADWNPAPLLLFAAALIATAPTFAGEQPTEPNPKLTAEAVVAAQLHALAHNDEPQPDQGIRIAFRFASPDNKKTTGPVDRFIRMVRGPTYALMLNHRSARFGEMMMVEDSARQKVTLTTADGGRATYVFILSKQPGPPCPGCWMTDAVIRTPNHLPGEQIARVSLVRRINGGLPVRRSRR